MVDWLKANPAVSMDDYLWKISVPFAKIMAADATHVVYLSEKEAKKYKASKNSQRIDDPMQLLTDFGSPVLKNKDE